jgi:hypothetical protein
MPIDDAPPMTSPYDAPPKPAVARQNLGIIKMQVMEATKTQGSN